jgi:hypothetical protein
MSIALFATPLKTDGIVRRRVAWIMESVEQLRRSKGNRAGAQPCLDSVSVAAWLEARCS